MRPRRHLPPLRHWRLGERLRALRDRLPLLRRRPEATWALAAAGALVLGYLTAYLVLFPAPILPSRQEVPRVGAMHRLALRCRQLLRPILAQRLQHPEAALLRH